MNKIFLLDTASLFDFTDSLVAMLHLHIVFSLFLIQNSMCHPSQILILSCFLWYKLMAMVEIQDRNSYFRNYYFDSQEIVKIFLFYFLHILSIFSGTLDSLIISKFKWNVSMLWKKGISWKAFSMRSWYFIFAA